MGEVTLTVRPVGDDEVLGAGDRVAMLRLRLDLDGRAVIEATERLSGDRSTLMSVWLGREQEWACECSAGAMVCPNALAIEELADALAPLLQRAHDGHSVQWDGQNNIGRLTDDAAEASDAIMAMMSRCEWTRDDVSIWNADEWIGSMAGDGVGVNSTDGEIDAMAEDDARQAREDGVILIGSTAKARRDAREELREMSDLPPWPGDDAPLEARWA